MIIKKVQLTNLASPKIASKIQKGTVLGASLFMSVKEAAAHPSPFLHTHNSEGKAIGLLAGAALFLASIVTAAVLIYKSYKSQDLKELNNKKDNTLNQ